MQDLMWKPLREKDFIQIFKRIFIILLQKSMKQSEYEFSALGEVSAQVEEIKLLYLISSCFGSFLLPQAGTTLVGFSGRNLVNKNLELIMLNYFSDLKKKKIQVFTLLWMFTVGKLWCLLKLASGERLFLSELNNFCEWLNRNTEDFETVLSCFAVI